MGTVPQTRIEKVQFYEAHISPWTENAVAIGLTTAEMAAFSSLVKNARGAYDAHRVALDASKAATESFYNNVRTMQNDGAGLIRSIKNKAETTGDPNVYVLAQIPSPATPTPVGPPGTPTDFRIELLQYGGLKLSFKCSNPSGSVGTIYEVKRRNGATGEFVYIGATGVKNFTDATLPSGLSSATYQITAIRSTASGNPAQFTINFGVGGFGAMQGGGFSITNEAAEFAMRGPGYHVEIPEVMNGAFGHGANGMNGFAMNGVGGMNRMNGGNGNHGGNGKNGKKNKAGR